MLIVGERINSCRKQIAQAVSSSDAAFIQNEAKAQAAAGADYIDVKAGSFVGEEMECLKWLIEVVQEVTDLLLCPDSLDPEVIESALPLVKTPPTINSITLERSYLEEMPPLVVQYKTRLIALSGHRVPWPKLLRLRLGWRSN